MELRELNLRQTKKDLRKALEEPDKRIMQTVNALSEMDDSLNVMAERLEEWYSLYYPEAVKKLGKHEIFAKVAEKARCREDFKGVTKETIGADLGKDDLRIMREFAGSVYSGFNVHDSVEKYLGKLMKESYPNLKAVAGDIVGAKLIAQVGGAKRLAMLPSSTIQVLGAEKALFRHMKTGAKPPKYGIILQHQHLQRARRGERGKISRALAASISIAIKRDVFGGEFLGNELNAKLERKIKRIVEKAARKRPK